MILKNCTIIENNKERLCDIEITDKKISKIADSIPIKDEERVVDIQKKLLLPGAIDLNFHINNIASKKVESFEEAIKSTYKGGVTTVLIQPDSQQRIDNESTASFVHLKAKTNGFNNVLVAGNAVSEEKLNDISIMLKSGVSTVSIDSLEDSNLLRRSLEYTKQQPTPLIVNPKNDALECAGVIHDGEVSATHGLPALPDFAESSEIAKVGEMANALESDILLNYTTSQRSLKWMSSFKDNKNIYTSVPLVNLFMSDEDCSAFNTINKTFPPLRSRSDRDALIDAIKDGTLDVISSNHYSRSYVSKDVPFEEASFGIAVSAIFYSLLYTYTIQTNKLTWSDVLRVTCKTPAEIFHLNKGTIEEGRDADLVVFNTDVSTTISSDLFESKDIGNICKFGETLQGKVEKVFIQGEEVIG